MISRVRDGGGETAPRGRKSPIEAHIANARRGDPEALAALYEHFRADLVSYADRKMGTRVRRWIQPESLAEDALVEILGKSEGLPADLDESRLRARLLRTATNRIRDHARKFQRHEGSSAVPAGKREEGFETHSVSHRERRTLIEELLERLPEEYRDIVRLCGLEEMSYAEAARRLGLKQDTVRKRFERASATLKKRLEARGYEP